MGAYWCLRRLLLLAEEQRRAQEDDEQPERQEPAAASWAKDAEEDGHDHGAGPAASRSLGDGPTRKGGRKSQAGPRQGSSGKEGKEKKKQTGQAQDKQQAGLSLPVCIELKKNSVNIVSAYISSKI